VDRVWPDAGPKPTQQVAAERERERSRRNALLVAHGPEVFMRRPGLPIVTSGERVVTGEVH
jgi:hypothetical protein